jgi:hypothetical protein
VTVTATGHVVKTGRKTHQKGVTTEDRRNEVAALYAALDEWQKDKDPKFIAEVTAKFDGYSERNALLIAMQRPEATDVDSRYAWMERGRVPVGKDTAIRIVRPLKRWTEPDPADPKKTIEHVSHYVWRGLFDVATTIEVDPAEIALMRANKSHVAPQVQAWRDAHPGGTWA